MRSNPGYLLKSFLLYVLNVFTFLENYLIFYPSLGNFATNFAILCTHNATILQNMGLSSQKATTVLQNCYLTFNRKKKSYVVYKFYTLRLEIQSVLHFFPNLINAWDNWSSKAYYFKKLRCALLLSTWFSQSYKKQKWIYYQINIAQTNLFRLKTKFKLTKINGYVFNIVFLLRLYC